MHRRPTSSLAAAAALLALAAWIPSPLVAALPDSLPSVPSGSRPGPDVLYAPPPTAPQLENRDPRFTAPPLLVSGTEAYVDGEYLYQDYLYDDYGSDTDGVGGIPQIARSGDVEYPTDRARYGNNAADLVELRIKVSPTEVAYRITLNTLLAADSTIVTIAFDTDRNVATGAATLLRDPGAPFPGTDESITTWGTGAEHTRYPTVGAPVTTPLVVTTDLEANQITITVPRTVSNPTGTWRAIAATGLYDPATGGWLRPQQTADATHPGGADLLDLAPSGIFNQAFRFDEFSPLLTTRDRPPDSQQSVAIRAKTPATYAHDIDFAALTAGTTRSTVPATGWQIRIMPSRLDLGEGRDTVTALGSLNDPFPQYLGQLQQYALYVPTTYTPGTPAGLVMLLHSLGEHHWQYLSATLVQQIGEARGAFVATSESRGSNGWYIGAGEYDVFEMWNDVAARFDLDPTRTVMSGYSMGGYATYRLPTLFPGIVAKAFSQVGPPADGIWIPPNAPTGGAETLTNLWLENARNVDYLNVAASADELVPIPGPIAQNLGNAALGIRGLDQLGYRFRFLVLSPSDHFAQAAAGYDYPFAADFLGDATIELDPPHVTFAYVPASDDVDLGLIHDHAYWISAVSLRDTTPGAAPAKGVIDVRSHGFGVGDPSSTPGATAGAVPPFTYVETNRTWNAPPAEPIANVADVALTNLGSARIDLARARLDPAATLTLPTTSDGDAILHLDGAFPPGRRVLEDGAVLANGTAGPGGAVVPVRAGTHVYTIADVTCAAAPIASCRRPAHALAAQLQLHNVTPDAKDRLLWKWTHGAATSRADFGNPVATTSYALCLYDGIDALLASFAAPAAGTCHGRPCWKANARGYRYVDTDATPSGLRQIVLASGAGGKAHVAVKGQGANLALPALPISHLPITVQLVSGDGACFEATYATTLRNQADQLKARGD
jgi:poly(3-hydroxybutyrate) depolymerase